MKWISQLWRGEFALSKAFWVFGVLIPVLLLFVTKYFLMIVMFLVLSIGMAGPGPPPGLFGGSMLIIVAVAVASLAYQVLAAVGIWRSAGKFPGDRTYSILARVVVAFYLLYFVGGVVAAVYAWFTTYKR
jgi:hypothetical protein